MIRCIAILVLAAPLAQAGEWMFRLKDAHVHLRRALFDRNAEGAWEQVNRSTRQDAGRLAMHIRASYADLPAEKKAALRKALGKSDAALKSVRGMDLLVAPFFLEAHPFLLTGDRDDRKLKDHGTKMAGPTAIVVRKKTPDAQLVPYTFAVENHFGCQAMDYRAQLAIPSLASIIGPTPKPAPLPEISLAEQAVSVFLQARAAFKTGDTEALWPLLDCDSQSMANHFADQARERAAKQKDPAGIAGKLGISESSLKNLRGPLVWTLPWAAEDLAYLLDARDPEFLGAGHYDRKLVPQPEAYRHRGKPFPAESVIAFQSGKRRMQIPVRVNHRNGVAEVKLLLRPPLYLRLRK